MCTKYYFFKDNNNYNQKKIFRIQIFKKFLNNIFRLLLKNIMNFYKYFKSKFNKIKTFKLNIALGL